MASIYKKKNNRGKESPYWWVRYYIKGMPYDKSLKVRNKEVANRLRNKLEEQLALGEIGLENFNDIPIEEYRTEFYKILKDEVALLTQKEYERVIDSFVEFLKNKYPNVLMLSQIDDRHVVNYLSGRLATGIAKTTRNNDLKYIRSFLEKAKIKKYIKSNPTAEIADFKVAKIPPRIYSEEDIRLMMKAPKELRTKFIFLLQTGVRKKEMIHCDWSDIKFNQRVVAVTVKPDFTPKDYERREIPLRKETREALIEMKQDKGRVFKGIDRHLDRTFKHFFDKIGIKGNVKIFRSTFASYSLACGIPLQNVQRYMGHSDIETTQVYLSTMPDKISEDIKEFFGGK